MDEKWLPVVGYEGLYEVSDRGRVKSLSRTVTGYQGSWTRGELMLSPWSGDRKRQLVSLVSGGVRKTRSVHVLEARAFFGPCPKGMEVCHLDDNSSNNLLSNLRYDTHPNNCRDRTRNGGDFNANKSRCPLGHLLMEPNLRKAGLRDGKRQCLSCAQARTTIWKRGEGDLAEIAQRNYLRLSPDRGGS